MAELGRLTAVFDADHRRFDAGARHVAAKVTGLTDTFTGLTGGGRSAIATLSGLASPMAIAAGGAVVAASAIGGITVGLWKLVTSSAELGGELHDLSQKTNFAVETLSGLSNVAKTADTDIKSISNSLFIFQGNMVKARDGNSEIGKSFRALKVDTEDQEKALRQAMRALFDMGETEEQAAKAKQLFGKAGKDVLGIIKATNGDLDEAIKRYDKLGLIVSSSAAKASDKFNDVLEETEMQLAAVTRAIGMELLPTATKTLQDISSWLAQNKSEWKAWGTTTVSVIGEVVTHIGYIIKGLKSVMTLSPIEIQIIERVQRVEAISQAQTRNDALGTGVGAIWWLATQSSGKPDSKADFSTATGGVGGVTGKGRTGFGGGGGKGGGGAQKDILEGLKTTVMSLQGEFRKYNTELLDSASLTALAAEKEKLLADVMSSLNMATRQKISGLKDVDQALEQAIGSLPKKSQAAAKALVDQALATAKNNLETKNAGEITKQVDEVMKQWKQDIDNTRTGADEYTLAIQQLEQAYRKYESAMEPGTKREMESLAVKLRLLKVERERLSILSQTRERFVAGDLSPDGTFRGDATRPRIATVEEQVTRERLATIREQMEGLASDLTSILDRAIFDGIKGGGLRGLQSLTLGFLDMIQQVIMGELKKALTEALSGAAGGGGILGKILSTVFGIAAGSIGGTGAAGSAAGSAAFRAIGRASGGPMSAGMPYLVHKDELIVPSQNSMVYNKQQQRGLGGTVINNNHINVTVPRTRGDNFRQQRSRREIAERIAALLAT